LLDILKILAKVSDFSCETAKPKVAVTMLQLQFPYKIMFVVGWFWFGKDQ